jgi:methionyl-tRNA synthetase
MYIITTPLPYTNDAPHLGHLLEGLYTDCVARYHKNILNKEVMLTMGLDQHGLKIFQKAEEKNIDPSDFVNQTGLTFTDLWKQFNVEYTEFIPTHSKRHELLSQSIFRTLQKKGFIYSKQYNGLYCVGCEDFYAPSQLDEHLNCLIHKTPVIKMDETNYFFQLSKFEKEVVEFLDTISLKPEGIRTEWLSFVSQGLQDISCTREKSRLPWGIPVPNDESQVMYVWIEALLNYCTALFTEEELLKLSDEEVVKKLQKEYPIDLMYCSKEISKFHLVIFPALLTALEIPLPLKCIAHGMINDAHGVKMSKSLGNGITPSQVLEQFSVEETRFIMLHEINIYGDSSFDFDRITDNYNTFLANNLGNIFTRVTTLAEKYGYNLLSDNVDFNWTNYNVLFVAGDTKLAFDEIFKACSIGNDYLEQHKPWMLAKDETRIDELKKVLGSIINHILNIAEFISPFMPETSQFLLSKLEVDKIVKIEPVFVRKVIEEKN